MPRPNRFLEAFKENPNLVGLTTAVAASIALLNPVPLLIGFAAEAAYLLFVPDSKWYEARLGRKNDAEIIRRRQMLRDRTFPLLHTEMQARFTHLESMRTQINTQAKDDQKWFLEVLRKLDYLLEKFLMFATSEAQFRNYLCSVWQESRAPKTSRGMAVGGDNVERIAYNPNRRSQGEIPPRQPVLPSIITPARGVADKWVPQLVRDVQAYYQVDIDKLQDARAKEQDENAKAILDKRIEVLQQRNEYSGKIGRILLNLNNQMELLEDTFGLINDQIRARSPEQVLSDIEGVVYQTDSMTKLLEELAPYQQVAENISG